jgi:hypothetical protein
MSAMPVLQIFMLGFRIKSIMSMSTSSKNGTVLSSSALTPDEPGPLQSSVRMGLAEISRLRTNDRRTYGE